MRWQDFNYEEWEKENEAFDHEKWDAIGEELKKCKTLAEMVGASEDIDRPPWKPGAYYNETGDLMEIYLSSDPSYVKWLAPGIEVRLSFETNEVTGMVIWGMKRKIERAEAG